MLQSLLIKARAIKTELYAVYLACHDPRTPWNARLLAILVIGYALSPIDLIPDFIPIFGYLDDVILVPLGIWLLVRTLPRHVMADARRQAAQTSWKKPASRSAAICIVILWLLAMALSAWILWQWIAGAQVRATQSDHPLLRFSECRFARSSLTLMA